MSEFERALKIFDEAFAGMNFVEGQALTVDEPSHESRRERCLEKLGVLEKVWKRDREEFNQLSEEVKRSVRFFASGDMDMGKKCAKEVDRMLWGIRNGPPPARGARGSTH